MPPGMTSALLTVENTLNTVLFLVFFKNEKTVIDTELF